MLSASPLMPSPLFTVIIFAWRPSFLPRSLKALLDQTYGNLEILLVDNFPAQDDEKIGHQVSTMVADYAKKDSRIRVLRIPRIQYGIQDILKNYYDCCTIALNESKGEYFFVQNDDDYISIDYIEKLVRLFNENPESISATGLTLTVDADGKPTHAGPRLKNYRPRHMPGHILALDVLRKGFMFDAPGLTVFAFRKKDYLRLGGFSPASDLAILYGIIAFGMTSFDDTTHFHWVYHPNQFNKELSDKGWFATHIILSFLKEWKIEARWSSLWPVFSKEVVHEIKTQALVIPARYFAYNFYQLKWWACLQTLRDMWRYPRFWSSLPVTFCAYFPLWKERKNFARKTYHALKLEYPLRFFFKLCPSAGKKSAFLSRLQNKVNRKITCS